MDAQSYTAQERRAANQVWAAAGAYGFEPLFLARNTDGTIDFYMNCIVGLVHKYYGDALIRDIFSAWEGDVRQPMLDDMAWLYLENAAYRLELPRRPVLEALRFAHADYFFAIQYKLSRQEWMAKNQLVYTMQAARWRKVLGRTAPVMTPYESSLAAALEPETVPEPAQLKNDLLALFAKFALFDGKVRQKPALHLRLQGFWAKLATKTMPTQMIKTDRSCLHRKLLRALLLPAGAAAQGRAGTVHRGASGLSFVVQRRGAQPGAGTHPGGAAAGTAGRIAGRTQPRLLCKKSRAESKCCTAPYRADPQLHSGASAARPAGGPQR